MRQISDKICKLAALTICLLIMEPGHILTLPFPKLRPWPGLDRNDRHRRRSHKPRARNPTRHACQWSHWVCRTRPLSGSACRWWMFLTATRNSSPGFKPWARPSRASLGQAKPGQSRGLTMALVWPEILESQSRRLRPRLVSDFFSSIGRLWQIILQNWFGLETFFRHIPSLTFQSHCSTTGLGIH